jgi:hypothetical protein
LIKLCRKSSGDNIGKLYEFFAIKHSNKSLSFLNILIVLYRLVAVDKKLSICSMIFFDDKENDTLLFLLCSLMEKLLHV